MAGEIALFLVILVILIWLLCIWYDHGIGPGH